MMLTDGKGQIGLPEFQQPVGFFLPVPVNIQVDLRSLAVDKPGYFPGRIERFRIGKIIQQFGKIGCHLVRVRGRLMLDLQPAVFVLFYKKGLSQSFPRLGCKIMFFYVWQVPQANFTGLKMLT